MKQDTLPQRDDATGQFIPAQKVRLVRGEITEINAGANRLVVLSCPWFITGRSAAVQWVSEMYEWREVGGLQAGSLPVGARRAVTAFARGISRRQAHDMEKAREESERKRGK